jgi:hypothetical protein
MPAPDPDLDDRPRASAVDDGTPVRIFAARPARAGG